MSCLILDISHRGQLSVALQTFTSLPAHYAPHKWTSLESYMLSQAIDTHSTLGSSKDQQWINNALSFLRTYVDDRGRELLMQEDDKVAYVTRIVEWLGSAVADLETGMSFDIHLSGIYVVSTLCSCQRIVLDMTYSEHPALSVKLSGSDAKLSETEDGSYLEVTVHNRLPCVSEQRLVKEYVADVPRLFPYASLLLI